MKKTISVILLIVLLSAVTITGCSSSSSNESENASIDSAVDNSIPSYEYKEEDTDESIDSENAKFVNLTTSLSIDAAGTYVLSGTIDDGQIYVDVGEEDVVKIVLSGASITCSSAPAIYVEQADKVVLVLADGTENTVSDGTSYNIDEDEPFAAIFSKEDLSITGNGKLEVTGNYYNGIGSKDQLCITGGEITVSAVNDGLRGRDGVAIKNCTVDINASNDGIKSNNAEEALVVIDGGTVNIEAGADGMQSDKDLVINDGTVKIITGEGSGETSDADAAASTQNGAADPQGQPGQQTVPQEDSESTEDDVSIKGLKSSENLYLVGGDVTLNCEDDAVHSNGNIQVNNGNLDISTGDDAFHSDNALLINNGVINVETCYEGLEGLSVEINGGEIEVNASDDAVNSAGGNSEGDQNTGGFGEDQFGDGGGGTEAVIEGADIIINGGKLTTACIGDGLDSNGNIEINGGEVYVSAQPTGVENSVDANGEFSINSGIFIATGGTEMFNAPSASSEQANLIASVNQTSGQNGSSEIILSEGSNKLASFTPKYDYTSIIISTPDMSSGESYSLTLGGVENDITLSGAQTQLSL